MSKVISLLTSCKKLVSNEIRINLILCFCITLKKIELLSDKLSKKESRKLNFSVEMDERKKIYFGKVSVFKVFSLQSNIHFWFKVIVIRFIQRWQEKWIKQTPKIYEPKIFLLYLWDESLQILFQQEYSSSRTKSQLMMTRAFKRDALPQLRDSKSPFYMEMS